MFKWIGLGWIVCLLAGCTVDKSAVPDRVCLLIQSNSRLFDNPDPTTDQQEAISYNGGLLQTFSRQSSTGTVSLAFSYLGGQVAQAATNDKTRQLNLEYDANERLAKASFLINNREQAVFSLYYSDAGRRSQLQRLVETRTTTTHQASIASRSFAFDYDPATGEVNLQTVQNSFKDGSRSEEELRFSFTQKYHSPYYDQDQRLVLALVALTDTTEMTPIRFLQRYEVTGWERRRITPTGSSTLRESATYSVDYDGNFNPIRQTQVITSYPDNAVKRYLQTFLYNCQE